MPRDWNADRKLGAIAIEAEIDRQLESVGFPILERSWICDQAGFEAGIEITYLRPDRRKVSAKFNAHELKWYCRRQLPETVEKIRDVVLRLSKGPANGRSE